MDGIDDMISGKQLKTDNLDRILNPDKKGRFMASIGLLLTPNMIANSYILMKEASGNFSEIVSKVGIFNNFCLLLTPTLPIISTIGVIYYNSNISRHKKEKIALENAIVYLKQARDNNNPDNLRRINRVTLLIESFILRERHYREMYKSGNYSLETEMIIEGKKLGYSNDEIKDNIDIVRTMIKEGFNYKNTVCDEIEEEIISCKKKEKELYC